MIALRGPRSDTNAERDLSSRAGWAVDSLERECPLWKLDDPSGRSEVDTVLAVEVR